MKVNIVNLLIATKLAISRNEARRTVANAGRLLSIVRDNNKTIIETPEIDIEPGDTLCLGSRHKITIAEEHLK